MTTLPCTCDSCEIGVTDHLLDGLDTGNSLLSVRKSQRNRTQQLAVDINRTSAHSQHDSGSLQRATGQSSQNDGLLWGDVPEYTEDFDLELFDAVPLEDGPTDAVHSGTDIAQWEKTLRGNDARAQHEKNSQRRDASPQQNEGVNKYFRPRRGGDLTHVSHCLSKLVQTSLCD